MSETRIYNPEDIDKHDYCKKRITNLEQQVEEAREQLATLAGSNPHSVIGPLLAQRDQFRAQLRQAQEALVPLQFLANKYEAILNNEVLLRKRERDNLTAKLAEMKSFIDNVQEMAVEHNRVQAAKLEAVAEKWHDKWEAAVSRLAIQDREVDDLKRKLAHSAAREAEAFTNGLRKAVNLICDLCAIDSDPIQNDGGDWEHQYDNGSRDECLAWAIWDVLDKAKRPVPTASTEQA